MTRCSSTVRHPYHDSKLIDGTSSVPRLDAHQRYGVRTTTQSSSTVRRPYHDSELIDGTASVPGLDAHRRRTQTTSSVHLQSLSVISCPVQQWLSGATSFNTPTPINSQTWNSTSTIPRPHLTNVKQTGGWLCVRRTGLRWMQVVSVKVWLAKRQFHFRHLRSSLLLVVSDVGRCRCRHRSNHHQLSTHTISTFLGLITIKICYLLIYSNQL